MSEGREEMGDQKDDRPLLIMKLALMERLRLREERKKKWVEVKLSSRGSARVSSEKETLCCVSN